MRPDLFLLDSGISKKSICIFSLLYFDLLSINQIFYSIFKWELSLMKIAYKSPVHKVINFLKTAAMIGRKSVLKLRKS